MKIIKLLLVLSVGLWAEFKLDVPKTIDVSQLENIVKNGWNDSNRTLNHLIVSYVEKNLPEVLEKIQKPVIKSTLIEDENFPIPNIQLNRDDYYLFVSYIKYLEANNRLNDAIKLYGNAYIGIESIGDESFIALIARIIFEQIVTRGLKSGIQEGYYNKAQKKSLNQNIKDMLLVDRGTIYKTLESERKISLKLLQISLLKKPKNQSVEEKTVLKKLYESVEKDFNMYFNKLYLDHNKSLQENQVIFDRLVVFFDEEIERNKIDFNNREVLNKEAFLINDKNLKNFLTHFDKETYQVMSAHEDRPTYEEFVSKLKSLSGQVYVSERLSKAMALASIPKVTATFLEYLEQVEQNKVLLKELEN